MTEETITAATTDTPASTAAPSLAPTASSPTPTASPGPAPSPEPTPAPTNAGGKTILDGGGEDKDPSPPADWPADWRTKMAGEDKKLLAQLERFGSPVDMAKKIREQDALISSGKLKQALPKDATTEQLAAYRKENGVPEAADKYDLTLPDGLVIGEQDKPIVNNMLTTMHGLNLNNDQVKAVLASYYQQEKDFLIERENTIAETKKIQDDKLHAEWGAEYRQNVNVIGSLIKTFSEETRNSLAGAVDSDGFPLLNNPGFLRDMVVMARTINPVDTVVSTDGGNQMSSIDSEIKGIESRMGGVDPTYYKDEKAQARYRQLIDWRDRQKKTS